MNSALSVMKMLAAAMLAATLFCGCPSSRSAVKSNDPAYPLLTVFGGRDDAQFSINAAVAEIYRCPPCPPGAMCKPCIGDHVVITDLQGNHMRIFTSGDLDRFQAGKKYTFYLKRRVAPKDEAELVKFE